KAFSATRRVRGDGSCFFRAVAFGAIEALAAAPAGGVRLRKVRELLTTLRFDGENEALAASDHAFLLSVLQDICDSLGQDGLPVSMQKPEFLDAEALDRALVRAGRRLVADHIRSHLDEATPGGLTYRELIAVSGNG
ncbi:unnamed protein product, partial [Phaeothamnion confervicola]